MIRTIIVDDEILSRIGLQSFLDGKEDIVVAGIFGEAQEALQFLEENMVDIVLTDIEMAEIDGLEFIQQIRRRNLASGVIIVSCHDDFSYAQRAISLGTDSYILKHGVTEKALIQEVKAVYEKTVENGKRDWQNTESNQQNSLTGQAYIYRIGVFLLESRENGPAAYEQSMSQDMLIHLLEEIVSRYKMGTLFAPDTREIFLLFQMEKSLSEDERKRTLDNWLQLLEKNIKQYVNETIILGLSLEFASLPETKEQYQKAILAAEQHFFHEEEWVFCYREITKAEVLGFFSTKYFFEEEWMDRIETELTKWLEQAAVQQLSIFATKNMLLQNIQQMLHCIMTEYRFSEKFQKRWGQIPELFSDIGTARNSRDLKAKVLKIIEKFRNAALDESIQNPLIQVINYIDENLNEKLTLPELAQMSCMSVPCFCKKFKEQTSMTVMQYITDKRIEYAAVLLKQPRYSLEEVAEIVGFSNANYLLRVFKKSTGETIGQYRKNIRF